MVFERLPLPEKLIILRKTYFIVVYNMGLNCVLNIKKIVWLRFENQPEPKCWQVLTSVDRCQHLAKEIREISLRGLARTAKVYSSVSKHYYSSSTARGGVSYAIWWPTDICKCENQPNFKCWQMMLSVDKCQHLAEGCEIHVLWGAVPGREVNYIG